MIGQLTGAIAYRTDRGVILDVSGVGYKVALSTDGLQNLPRTGPVTLWTHLAVRENALDLYGFVNATELEFFELLISVSGIGPKSALAILSLAPPETLEKAIVAGDSGYLTKVSGIGRKSAEKIVLELKDKLGSLSSTSPNALREEAEALEALQALGFNLREAREALKSVPVELTDTGERVKAALKALGK